jgi:hypothetical protein
MCGISKRPFSAGHDPTAGGRRVESAALVTKMITDMRMSFGSPPVEVVRLYGIRSLQFDENKSKIYEYKSANTMLGMMKL